METKNVSNLKIHKLTQAQYDRELAAGNIDEYALYLTPDEEIDLSPYATVEQVNGKANATHDHAISDVRGLQTALDGKAASSHGTHVSYSTTSPMMDGTASVGTASTVARSDHKHPTDTSRAAKTDLDSHTSNTTVHITSEERTNWNAAKTHAGSAHAPSNAEKNQNAFSNIAVGSMTIAADSATDTLILEGSNVTITPDATNDKVTIGITKDNVTGALGYTPMDKANPTGTGAVSINRKADTTVGEYSVAMGNDNSAEGIGSFVMGNISTCGPDAEYSAALGEAITITGANSFSTGDGNTVSGSWSAVFGESNDMSANHGLAAGYGNTVRGQGGCAIGSENIVNYTCGVTLGMGCTAHYFALAQGLNTAATGHRSAAFNDGTTASGHNSAAFNAGTIASGDNSAAFGAATTALTGQLACGAANDTSSATAGTSFGGTGSGTAFVVGNGTTTYTSDGALLTEVGSNAFRVDYNGAAYGKSAYTTNGCDYAEYFEWKDSNPENEDRRGYFVTLDGEKIKIAEPGDYILGIISGHPAVIGNGDESWMGRYILDDFGDFIYEDFEYEVQEPEDVVNEETGEVTIQTKTVKKTGKKYKENPDYDPSITYIQRADRPEWDAVGMIGVLSVRDDGTCQVNGYCKVAAGGTATAAESGYRVVKRVNDNIVKVIFK